MKVAIWGATGATGSELLQRCFEDSAVDEVLIFGRRESGIENPKATEVLVEDFNDANSYAGATLDAIDVAFWCLGVSQSAVSVEARYREITFDYAMVAAKALKAARPEVAYLTGL